MAVITSLRAFQNGDEFGDDFLAAADAVGNSKIITHTAPISKIVDSHSSATQRWRILPRASGSPGAAGAYCGRLNCGGEPRRPDLLQVRPAQQKPLPPAILVAAAHATAILPQRPRRRRMAALGTTAAASTRRTPSPIPPPRNRQRHPLYPAYRIRYAGAAWRMLPHDMPPYRSVFHYCRTWRRTGVWQQGNDALRRQTRQSQGRHPEPGAAIIGSQSVKTAAKGGGVATTPAKSARAQAS